jgi:hypothetical protein
VASIALADPWAHCYRERVAKPDLSNVYVYLIGVLLAALTSLRGGCTTAEEAAKVLQINGFHDVKITDRAIFFVGLQGCDGDDAARYTTTAVNSRGERVSLYVCMGWPFKGSTIRTP